MPGDSSDFSPGARLGPYEIQKKLGSGGMGDVYLATDSQLRRPAAIKLLPDSKLLDETARRRFLHEAQAASALNHANIVTVYQIGSYAGREYIAMEYVPGTTLQRIVPRDGLGLAETLRYAVQIAAALAAAHEAGIVHRDLKPGNIMVTDRGVVKVVDFGLAKRTTAAAAPAQDEVTDTYSLTAPGLVAGTCAYMSPEQVQGREVDGRSDIWAFGCVLYFMLSGRVAFHGESPMDTMAAVLTREPSPLREIGPPVPPNVERLVMRCLQRKIPDRWQSAADLKMMLEDLETEKTTPAATPVRGARRTAAMVTLALIAGSAAGGAGFWLASRKAGPSAAASVLRRSTLDSGLSTSPALSRDGSLMAFASDRGGAGNLDIWLQQVGGREPIRLTDDPADDSSPSISPDGTKVAFRSERNGGGVYVVGALGGDAVLIAAGGRNPKFSPDGRWIAYWAGRDSLVYRDAAKVFIVESGGGTPRQIAPSLAVAMRPVWSPAGDELLALARDDDHVPEQASVDWWVLPLSNGAPRKTGAFDRLRAAGLLHPQTPAFVPFEWLAGPPAVVTFSASFGDPLNLWEVPVSSTGRSGPPRRITNGPGRQTDASTVRTATTLRRAFADQPQNHDIWSLPVDADRGVATGDFSRLTSYATAEYSPALSWDGGRLVFLSRVSGGYTLRLRELSSGRESTLLGGERFLASAVLAGNGGHIFFANGTGDIAALAPSGGAAEELCGRCGTVMGASSNGAMLLYEPLQDEDLTLWDAASRRSRKVALRRTPTSILSGGRFSPDGRWIAFHEVDNRSGMARIWIVPAGETVPVPASRWIAVTDGAAVDQSPAWAPGGSLLYFLSERDGFRCIWARRLDASRRPAGEPFPVEHFHAARWSLSSMARGHQIGLTAGTGRLVFAMAELTGNIWIEDTPLTK